MLGGMLTSRQATTARGAIAPTSEACGRALAHRDRDRPDGTVRANDVGWNVPG